MKLFLINMTNYLFFDNVINPNLFKILFFIFLPLACVIVIVAIFLAIFIPIRNHRLRTYYKENAYKVIYKVANENDYYLINNFIFKVEDSKVATIDHILFGNKFIYLITDYYYEGEISGDPNDASLVFLSRKDKKYYTDNMYRQSLYLISRLSMVTSLNPELMIGVIYMNDRCKMKVEPPSKQLALTNRKEFARLIRTFENTNIGKMNAKELESAVLAIDKLNKKKRN